ncbi:MAG: peptidoglycan D,D-transpeptidase FtsI family protein, partial [bacterium]
PGSTFKPVTLSAAMETAKVDEENVFYCDGGEMVSGVMIHCSELDGHGRENIGDAIRNSCNDALMQIGSLLGVEDFNRYQRIFHFGTRTGIDLSGEASGILYTADTMAPINLATASFGQGFSCTMIQEAAAIASIVNGGTYWQPHVAEKVIDSSGTVEKICGGTLLAQTVSEDTARKVKSYMKSAVDDGTAIYAKVNGYSMGGKTGTAEKFPRGEGRYLVSFIGFAPYEDPQVLIYVVVDEPNLEKQDDSRFAQWIARNVLAKILPYLNIYPDESLAPGNQVLLSDYDNPSGEPRSDSAGDDEIPAAPGVGEQETVPDNNTPEDLGYTNEEAGLGN